MALGLAAHRGWAARREVRRAGQASAVRLAVRLARVVAASRPPQTEEARWGAVRPGVGQVSEVRPEVGQVSEVRPEVWRAGQVGAPVASEVRQRDVEVRWEAALEVGEGEGEGEG